MKLFGSYFIHSEWFKLAFNFTSPTFFTNCGVLHPIVSDIYENLLFYLGTACSQSIDKSHASIGYCYVL